MTKALGAAKMAIMLSLATAAHHSPWSDTASTSTAVSTAAAALSTPSKCPPHLREKIANSVAKCERRAAERRTAVVSRPVCDRCRRPPSLCVCPSLPDVLVPLPGDARVLVLQHPNEFRKRNFSTVPLMSLVLGDAVSVHVGYKFEADEIGPIRDFIGRGQAPFLLFPGLDAESIDSDTSHRNGEYGGGDIVNDGNLEGNEVSNGANQNLLVLIDGTWSEAKRMVRESPSLLETCQQIQFAESDSTPRVYDEVRSEPAGHCLSTLEACARALPWLAGPDGAEDARLAAAAMSAVLRAHVDAHLANARNAEPRFSADGGSVVAKDRRRREIERKMFGGSSEMGPSSRSDGGVAEAESLSTGKVLLTFPDGATLRPLRDDDARVVDLWWDHRTPTSLLTVARRIEKDGGRACLGVEADGKLRACIVRYEGGALGMLHVEEGFRLRGYGSALLKEATRAVEGMGQECVALILDGNCASERLFAGQGWVLADPSRKKRTGRRRANRKWIKPKC